VNWSLRLLTVCEKGPVSGDEYIVREEEEEYRKIYNALGC
jgi:hypothetical protein